MTFNLLVVKGEFSTADFMEREAGHVTVSLLVMVAAYIMWKYGVPHAEALAGAAGGWLGRSMGSK